MRVRDMKGKSLYYKRKRIPKPKKEKAKIENLNSRFNDLGRSMILSYAEQPVPVVEILSAANQEIRAVLAETNGNEEFLKKIRARILHREGKSMLFETRVRAGGILKYVRVKDATSGRYYYLRVPPTVTTCKEAIAWTFGMTVEQYTPIEAT